MISISYSCHFDAAHRLDLPYDSPCNRPHGHRYRVEVIASADELENGMVVDFNMLQEVVERFDHCDLNALPDFARRNVPTTAENIAATLAKLFAKAAGPRVRIEEVVVRETPRSAARWRATRSR